MAVLAAAAASLGLATPAFAAPGDASATGVDVSLSAAVLGVPVITASATIGTATAPPGNGTDSETLLSISLPGALGVTATGTVDEVTATRAPNLSAASSTITGVGLDILGINVLGATAIDASVTCPAIGSQTATVDVVELELFGTGVTLLPNTPGVNGSATIVVPGLADASLDVTLTSTETVTPTGAAAVGVFVGVSLSGLIAGQPVVIDAGTVTLAEATCERPLATTPTASSINPNSGPQSGGQTVTITGSNFIAAGTTVTFDGAPATNVVVAPDGNSLTATTPAGAVGPAVVIVSTVAGASGPLNYTYLADDGGAVVTDLDPDSGPTAGGTTVTITGTGFTGATGVTFDDVPGTDLVVNAAGTSLTVVTPPGAVGPVDVVVQIPGADATAPDGYTYLPVAPTVGALDPDHGPTTGGTHVTIEGTGFVPWQTAVTICGKVVGAEDVVVRVDGRSLTFRTPPCEAGATTVSVTTSYGTSNGLAYRYIRQDLPVTGASLGTPLKAGGVMLALGALLFVAARRRNRNTFQA